MLIYDGLHYDALAVSFHIEISTKAFRNILQVKGLYKTLLKFLVTIIFFQMSPFEGAPEEFDQTIFPVNKDRTIGAVENLALNLVKDANR